MGWLKRHLAWFAAILVFGCSYGLNLRGIRWEYLHPDEYQIAKWVKSTQEHRFIRSRVYPEGFFRLAPMFRRAEELHDKTMLRMENWERQGVKEHIPSGDVEQDEKTEFRTRRTLLLRARYWNALLVALSAVFVFLMGRETLRCTGWSLLAALLYALHPFVVEHAHYAETDGAMLFGATLSLWLLSRAARKDSLPLLALASLAAGFAIASKFSLLLLAGLLPLNAFLIARRTGRGTGQAALFAVGALAVLALGFVLATPKLYLEPHKYMHQLHRIRKLTYGEMRRILGEGKDTPHAGFLFKMRSLKSEILKFGIPWLLWMAASLLAWFRKRFRVQWSVVPLFGLAYPVYAMALFPWFRNQELLPWLPFVALTTFLPAVSCPTTTQWHRRLLKPLCILCPLLLLGRAAWQGVNMAEAFGTGELRMEAKRWLNLCAPRDRKILFETYAGLHIDVRDSEMKHASCDKLEFVPPETWEELDCDYVLRAPEISGRGSTDPFTGDLYPTCRANRDHILSGLHPLRNWRLSSPAKPLFSQVEVELLGQGQDSDTKADVPVLAPLYLHADHYGTGGMHVSPGREGLGPMEALKVTGRRTRVTFSPPGDDGVFAGRYYGVAFNLSGKESVAVSWSRGFTPKKADVPAGKAVLFTSTAELKSPFEPVGATEVRLRGDDQTFHTLVVFTADPRRAAAILRAFGNEEAAATLPEKEPDVLPESLLADFSHASLGPITLRRDAISFDPRHAAQEGVLEADLPLALLKGQAATLRLRIAGTWTFSEEDNGGDPAAVRLPEFLVGGTDPVPARALGWDANGALAVELDLPPCVSPEALWLGVRAPKTVDMLQLEDVDLRWKH